MKYEFLTKNIAIGDQEILYFDWFVQIKINNYDRRLLSNDLEMITVGFMFYCGMAIIRATFYYFTFLY
jgi:hypothetical protein